MRKITQLTRQQMISLVRSLGCRDLQTLDPQYLEIIVEPRIRYTIKGCPWVFEETLMDEPHWVFQLAIPDHCFFRIFRIPPEETLGLMTRFLRAYFDRITSFKSHEAWSVFSSVERKILFDSEDWHFAVSFNSESDKSLWRGHTHLFSIRDVICGMEVLALEDFGYRIMYKGKAYSISFSYLHHLGVPPETIFITTSGEFGTVVDRHVILRKDRLPGIEYTLKIGKDIKKFPIRFLEGIYRWGGSTRKTRASSVVI